MTTAEKITLGVSIATALGVGALLKSLFDHLLDRPEKKVTIAEKEVTIADKSVQIANTMMTMMDAQLTRLQATLAEAQKESGGLRAELAQLRAAREPKAQATATELRIAAASAEIDESLREAQSLQRDVEDRLKQLTVYVSSAMIDRGVDFDAATMTLFQAKGAIDRPDDDGGAVGALPKPRR